MENNKLKIVRVLACPKCKDYRVCPACQKNPKHQPQIVEVWELPRLIRHAECGNEKKPCCALFSCSRIGCDKTFFRIIAVARQKKRQFCSTRCRDLIHSAEYSKKIQVPCANCGAAVMRKPHQVKSAIQAFCKRICHVEWRIKQAFLKKNGKFGESVDLQMNVCMCIRHRGLAVNFKQIKGHLYECCEGTEKNPDPCRTRKQIHPNSIHQDV